MNLRGLRKRKTVLEKQYNIQGMYVLLTGRVPKYTRLTIEKMILAQGGYLQDKANYNTNIVVFTRQDTAKFKAATHINRGKTVAKGGMIFVKGEDFVADYLKMEEL